jgi:hypothetical protein
MAVRLMYASLVIGIIRVIFFPYLREHMFIGPHLPERMFIVPLCVMIFFCAIDLFLIYMTGKGKNWARIIIFALFILVILDILFVSFVPLLRSMIIQLLSDNPISSVFGLLQFCLNIAGLILIFQNESSRWFRAIKELKNAKPVIKQGQAV